MRAVIQRVSGACVSVDGEEVGSVGPGLVVFLAVGSDDTGKDVDYIVDKIINLRIFEDEAGKMNLSVIDLGLEIMVVSQFTLYGDVRKGRRPSFTDSASPEKANSLYEEVVARIREEGIRVATGKFQADMLVRLDNDGPVTILLDSGRLF